MSSFSKYRKNIPTLNRIPISNTQHSYVHKIHKRRCENFNELFQRVELSASHRVQPWISDTDQPISVSVHGGNNRWRSRRRRYRLTVTPPFSDTDTYSLRPSPLLQQHLGDAIAKLEWQIEKRGLPQSDVIVTLADCANAKNMDARSSNVMLAE